MESLLRLQKNETLSGRLGERGFRVTMLRGSGAETPNRPHKEEADSLVSQQGRLSCHHAVLLIHGRVSVNFRTPACLSADTDQRKTIPPARLNGPCEVGAPSEPRVAAHGLLSRRARQGDGANVAGQIGDPEIGPRTTPRCWARCCA